MVTIVAIRLPGFREWLIADESGSTTIRNLGLLVGGIVAIALAVWRSRVAERQAAAAHRQAEIALRQAATAEHGLLNERYQTGAEKLGSDVLAARLEGVYALNRLAQEHPGQYHLQIMDLFCAFVRHPPRGESRRVLLPRPIGRLPRQDVNAVMKAIGTRNDVQIALERNAKQELDLRGANLSMQVLGEWNFAGARLGGANLSGASLFKTDLSKNADLFEANLAGARLPGTNLSNASLIGADLSNIKDCYGADFSDASLNNANLTDANLAGAIVNDTRFHGANLAGAKFYDESGMNVEGLTQRQIAFAKATPENNPPLLDGLDDAENDELIFWANRPKVIAGPGPHSQNPTGSSQT